jgi:predicted dinucleotide-binding enzyme
MNIVIAGLILIGFGAIGFAFAAWLAYSNQGVISSGRSLSARLGSVSHRLSTRQGGKRK